MAIPLKQSTASQEIPLGYFVDSVDGNTEETALTIANTDIKLWKNGATTLANKNSGGATHISNGIYYAVLDATDTNTAGPLVVFVHVSGALPVRVECEVYPANVYDSLFSSDNLQVDVVQISGAAVSTTTAQLGVNVVQVSGDATAADNAEAFFDGTGYAGTNNVIPTVTSVTNQVTANVTAVSGDTVAADNLEADYDGTGYAKAASTINQVNQLGTQAKADVNAEVDTALADIHLDHMFATDYDPASKPGTSTALLNELVESDAGVSRFTANALEQAPTGGSAPTAADVADAVFDEIRSGHTIAGSYGEAFMHLVSGQAATGTLSTTQMTTNLTEATNDHYNGRRIIWVTGNLAGQGTAITDYDGTSKMLTYTAVTEAPANGDRFLIF